MKTAHLTAEQIEIYARGTADQRLFDYVEDHRRRCALCDNLLEEDVAVIANIRDVVRNYHSKPAQASKPQQH
jgi:hypothetical protein